MLNNLILLMKYLYLAYITVMEKINYTIFLLFIYHKKYLLSAK